MKTKVWIVNSFSIFLLNIQKLKITKISNNLRVEDPWSNVKYRQYFIHLLFLRMPEARFNILAKTGLPHGRGLQIFSWKDGCLPRNFGFNCQVLTFGHL